MRILIVAMPDSVHAARWTEQIADQGWEIHLFPIYDAPPHPLFRNLTLHGLSPTRPECLNPSVQFKPVLEARPEGTEATSAGGEAAPRFVPYSERLMKVVEEVRPDIVHSMEMQHAGYLTLDAKLELRRRMPWKRFPPWIVSNWGSDIYLFGRLPEHSDRIRAVLAECDYYECLCQRDSELGKAFGFRGGFLPRLPAGGGFDLAELRRLRPPGLTSGRSTVVLKGYQNWAGRAFVALRAIERCADALRGYRIAAYLVGGDLERAIEGVRCRTGLELVLAPASMPREDVLALHGRARISIALSISDGASYSLLEAMAMGSFPIQSNTACADEWVVDGETAILVDPEDPGPVEAAIRRALSDDGLVDAAAAKNALVIAERLDERLIGPRVIGAYQRVAAAARKDAL